MPKHIHLGKALYLAGYFEGSIEDTAWCITKMNTTQPEPLYTCNVEETGMEACENKFGHVS